MVYARRVCVQHLTNLNGCQGEFVFAASRPYQFQCAFSSIPPAPLVLVNCPNRGFGISDTSPDRTVWFRALNMSARNWSCNLSQMGKLFPMEKSKFQDAGPRIAPFPTFPARIVSAETALTGTRANAAGFRYFSVDRWPGRMAGPPI